MDAFDDRIFQLGLQFENDMQMFDGAYQIIAHGTRYGNVQLNECECTIYNLDKQTRNYLLSQTSPFYLGNRSPKFMTIDVGRVSTGTFRLFQGNVIASNPTQPPDIGLTLKSMTGAFLMGNIMPLNLPAMTSLRTIAEQVAKNTSTTLQFTATDKTINNFSFTGAALQQVRKLAEVGNVNVFIDNGNLVVKDQTTPLPGTPRIINAGNGMVGIPVTDEFGVRVRVMIDNSIMLGGQITVQSEENPQANGTFTVYKMDFEIASRTEPFYYIVYASQYVFPTL